MDGVVRTANQWERVRRPELLSVFRRQMYGTLPGTDVEVTSKCLEESADAVGGKATRRQVELTFVRNGVERKAILLIYLPNGVEGPVPCFLGFNFQGNQTTSFDPAVIPSQYSEYPGRNRDSRWGVESVVDAGYALVTAHYYDFFYDREDDDFEGKYPKSIFALFGRNSSAGFSGTEGRAISAWAWGYSRVLDYLAGSEERIDRHGLPVMGHSRLREGGLVGRCERSSVRAGDFQRFRMLRSGSFETPDREDLHRILRFPPTGSARISTNIRTMRKRCRSISTNCWR